MPITPTNPFKGTPIPGRADSFVCALVPSLSFGLRACRRDHSRTGHSGRCQLHLALGPSVCARAEQEMSSAMKSTNKSYRVDETYIKVKGEDKFLYRAVDSTGQTIEFLLTAKRDAAAAKR